MSGRSKAAGFVGDAIPPVFGNSPPGAKRPPLATRLGRCISLLVVVALCADGIAQFLTLPVLRTEMEASGFPVALSPALGAITLSCAILYAIPRTAMLGAIVLTGFLGGAIAIHLRLGEMATAPQILCVALGAMAWGGLYLREPRLHALLPIRP